MSSNSRFTDPPDSLYQADDEQWREARDRPLPPDLRDEIQSPDDALREPTRDPSLSREVDREATTEAIASESSEQRSET
jgi:hypothetical protein